VFCVSSVYVCVWMCDFRVARAHDSVYILQETLLDGLSGLCLKLFLSGNPEAVVNIYIRCILYFSKY